MKSFSTKANLHLAALWFRLLRKQGLPVSPVCVHAWTCLESSRTKMANSVTSIASSASDEQGMLSLYEAAHVAVNGEDILEDALVFAMKKLKSIIQVNDHKKSLSSIS
ncbi:Beta-caryophyllene synthase [Linum perenne]